MPFNIVSSSLGNEDVLFLRVKTLEISWYFIFNLLTKCYYLLFNHCSFFPLYGMYSHMTELWQSPHSIIQDFFQKTLNLRNFPTGPSPTRSSALLEDLPLTWHLSYYMTISFFREGHCVSYSF